MGYKAAIVIALLFSFVFPIGLLIWWKKKSGEKLWPFIVGAMCFIIFAMALENILHSFCLTGNNALAQAITSSPVLYTLYASFAAGIFEETGRLFGFSVLLSTHHNDECSVAYGIGHGGIEVILILGMNYILLALAAFGVDFGSEAINTQLLTTAQAISIPLAIVAIIERVSAVMLHIGLSMLVFTAVQDKKKRWLYPLAILLHAVSDMPAALYQFKVLTSLFAVESFAFLMGVFCLFLGIRILKQRHNTQTDNIQSEVL